MQITVRKGLFFATSLRVNSGLFGKSSNLSVGRLGEQYKEMNLDGLFVINPWKKTYSRRYLIVIILKANDYF